MGGRGVITLLNHRLNSCLLYQQVANWAEVSPGLDFNPPSVSRSSSAFPSRAPGAESQEAGPEEAVKSMHKYFFLYVLIFRANTSVPCARVAPAASSSRAHTPLWISSSEHQWLLAPLRQGIFSYLALPHNGKDKRRTETKPAFGIAIKERCFAVKQKGTGTAFLSPLGCSAHLPTGSTTLFCLFLSHQLVLTDLLPPRTFSHRDTCRSRDKTHFS